MGTIRHTHQVFVDSKPNPKLSDLVEALEREGILPNDE